MGIGWLLRALLIVFVVRAIWRFLSGVVEGAQGRKPVPPPEGVPLVRDPVCGTYVVRSRALTLKRGDAVQYFCSERCRHAYTSQ